MTITKIKEKLQTCNEVNNLTPEELSVSSKITDDLIRNNLFSICQNIIYFYELSRPTKHSISIITTHLKELSKDLEAFILILDLSRAKRPNAEIREELKNTFLKDLNIKTLYIYTGKNAIITFAAKFILSSLLKKYNLVFVNSIEEALKLSQSN